MLVKCQTVQSLIRCGAGLDKAMVLVNFHWWGILLIWIIVGQWSAILAVGVGRVVWALFSSTITFLFFLHHSLRLERAQYKLKYCLKELLKPNRPF